MSIKSAILTFFKFQKDGHHFCDIPKSILIMNMMQFLRCDLNAQTHWRTDGRMNGRTDGVDSKIPPHKES